jgi:hypothetical protein
MERGAPGEVSKYDQVSNKKDHSTVVFAVTGHPKAFVLWDLEWI